MHFNGIYIYWRNLIKYGKPREKVLTSRMDLDGV